MWSCIAIPIWHNHNPTRLDLIESHWPETINFSWMCYNFLVLVFWDCPYKLKNPLYLHLGMNRMWHQICKWRWAWTLHPHATNEVFAHNLSNQIPKKRGLTSSQHFQWVDVLLDDEAKCMMCAQGTLEVTCSKSVAIVYIFLNL